MRLEQLILQRGLGETISDAVRFLIDSVGIEQPEALLLDKDTADVLESLAAEVSRSKVKVAEDCIFGVAGLLEGDRSPLIVEEIKLRRSYRSRSAGRVSLPEPRVSVG